MIDLEGVIAGQRRQARVAAAADLEQRPDARVAPHDLIGRDRLAQERVHLGQHVRDFGLRDPHLHGFVLPRLVGRADRGEVLFIGEGLHQPAIARLQEIPVLPLPLPGHDNMAAANHAQPLAGRNPGDPLTHL